ncbi:MAG: site-specific integrase, partial [Candidatus Latescibacterota bacterium]
VKIQKRGKNYQLYYYNPLGERRRITVGSDRDLAQRRAIKYSDWLLEGKDPEAEIKKAQEEEKQREKEKATPMTLRRLYPTFLERHGTSQSKSMQKSYKNSFKNLSRCIGIIDCEITALTKGIVLDYMRARVRQDGITNATVNREAAFLKCMLSRATEWDMLDRNPLQGLRLFNEGEKRNVKLTVEQAYQLIKSLSEPVSSMVEFAIYSGFRKENILGIKIEQILFHDISPTAEVEMIIKGGRKETFPLGSAAVEVLKRVIGNRKSGYVFINPITNTRYSWVNQTFHRATEKVGLDVDGKNFRFHDLRHVFATWLHHQGVSLDILRVLLGHRNRSTTDRYASFDSDSATNVLSIMPRIRGDRKYDENEKSKAS